MYQQACITLPNTCGVAGGAVALWAKPSSENDGGGIVTSRKEDKLIGSLYNYYTGFSITLVSNTKMM